MNLPNKITAMRFILAVVLFALLSQVNMANSAYLLDVSLLIFIIAALTDIVDGYLARKYDQVTALGRIADPFVDKILVSGSFVFLTTLTPVVHPWMVVVIIGREFLISGIRGYAESQGVQFPANIWGKMKTLLQCFTIAILFFYLAHLQNVVYANLLVSFLVWIVVGITLLSGVIYLVKAKHLLLDVS